MNLTSEDNKGIARHSVMINCKKKGNDLMYEKTKYTKKKNH